MNRPEPLTKLLASLAAQSERVGRIIVIDGAENAEPVVKRFSSELPVEYFKCHPPSQLRQRNLGIDQLNQENQLVALLDDDIVVHDEAIGRMIAFWNESPPSTAGVCFNVVNGLQPRRPLMARIRNAPVAPGRVFRSGNTTGVSHASRDCRVQWLPGGATVWRKDVLLRRRHEDIKSRWAIAEDVIFSYPIGKTEPLYVCANARVDHVHVSDYTVKRLDYYHGRTQSLWSYHFVKSNDDLSPSLFLATLISRALGKFIVRGVLRRDRPSREFAKGQASALRTIAAGWIRSRGSAELLQEF
ncbi:MAG: glycosyltransferase [Gemmatimonadaceae bacterium]|nr:glycosyltransferase [Gemmatimonadaceae bacterium]